MHRPPIIATLCLTLFGCLSAAATRAEDKSTLHKLQSGQRFGLAGVRPDGTKPAHPAPTLLVFAGAIEDTLGNDVYNRIGRLLVEQGWICVALDVPCHGGDHRQGEPEGIQGWATRIKQGEDVMAGLAGHTRELLDYLIAEGYTDPRRIAAAGTSRGGFSALHVAAADPRIRCVAAFAPVSELAIVDEFASLRDNELLRSLDLFRHSEKLADRPIWLCIGNGDERVGTDALIKLARELTAAADRLQKPSDVDLHVVNSRGHSIHPTAHEEAAAWVAKQFPD